MRTLIALELRRNRTVFLSVFGLMMLSFPLLGLLCRLHGNPATPEESRFLLGFWCLPGSFLVQIVFGLAGGVKKAQDSAAEEVIPAAPWKRALSGLAAALLYGLLFAGPAWICFGSIYPGEHLTQDMARIEVLAPMVLFLVGVSSYCFTYAFPSAVLGFASLAVFVGLMGPSVFLWCNASAYHDSLYPYWAQSAVALCVTCAGLVGMLFVRARTAALQPGTAVRWNFLAAMSALSGPVLCGAVAWGQVAWAERLPRLTWPLPGCEIENRGPFRKGLFLSNARGEIFFAGQDGTLRQLLPKSYNGFLPLMSSSYNNDSVSSYALDKDGSLWLLANVPDGRSRRVFQLWHFTRDGGKERIGGLDPLKGYYLRVRKAQDTVVEIYHDEGKFRYAAAVPSRGEPFKWRKKIVNDLKHPYYENGEMFVQEGLQAVSVVLDGRKVMFKLPFPLAQEDKKPVWGWIRRYEGNITFNVMLKSGNKSHKYYCFVGKDGKVRASIANWSQFQPPYDGMAMCRYVLVASASPFFVSIDGRSSAIVYLTPALRGVLGAKAKLCAINYLRNHDGVIDLLVEGWEKCRGTYLISIETSTGRLVSKHKLPVKRDMRGHVAYCRVGDDGFLMYAKPHVYAVKWDGTVKKVLN